ncbi:MAG TPA: class E sortase [Acidimicrobiales bacterium]|nr:class E sortase [Acidimicrobiales bacterium]
MRLLGTSRHRALVSLVSLAALVTAGACSAEDRADRERVPRSTLGRGQRIPILAPPTTSAMPTTTVLTDISPVPIPIDWYSPEPIKEFGTIEIPALGLVHSTYQGVTLNNIDLGPSHWPGTATPGRPGNTVFAGHRITNSRPFRHLDDLVAGDEVIFTVNGVRSVYRVTGNMIVSPDDTWIADQTPDATGTLYACHPPGSLAYRYVVRLALAS